MHNDFKPLRRKIGAVTLAMACVFMAGWVTGKAANLVHGISFPFDGQSYHILLSPSGIDLVRLVAGQDMNPHELASRAFVEIPHWSIVLPLTLLSAWLLLSKPRKKKSDVSNRACELNKRSGPVAQ